MKCAILQPSYIPWRGMFHQVAKSDVFVFYDDVQYDRRGWRNRNRIKTARGPKWLTIPVIHAGREKLINEIEISWQPDWRSSHIGTLKLAYGKAPFFKKFIPFVEQLYDQKPRLLSDFTIDTTTRIARELKLNAQFVRSSTLHVEGRKTERLLNILSKLGASHYITGPSAQSYLDEKLLKEAGISIEYMTYDYKSYPQLYPPFDQHVSVLDFLFMTGGELALDA